MSKPFPVDEDTRCYVCDYRNRQHYNTPTYGGGQCGNFRPPPAVPDDHEIVPALAVTTWECHVCGREQDVWGEGAINGWMDCQFEDCDAASWLSLDLALQEATPTP